MSIYRSMMPHTDDTKKNTVLFIIKEYFTVCQWCVLIIFGTTQRKPMAKSKGANSSSEGSILCCFCQLSWDLLTINHIENISNLIILKEDNKWSATHMICTFIANKGTNQQPSSKSETRLRVVFVIAFTTLCFILSGGQRCF